MEEKDWIWVIVRVGDAWLPGMNEMGRYGGWTPDYALGTLSSDMKRMEGSFKGWMKKNGYPQAKDNWLEDKFEDGDVFTDDEGEGCAFCIPPELHDEIFGPKFNELGEVAP
jgi:hypothetical protein